MNRYEKGSSYPQWEGDRAANAAGRKREDRDSMRRKPVELGKEYDVDIVEKSRREDGIARIDNFVIFVKKGVVGEKVRIKIESVSQSFAIASIVAKTDAVSGSAAPSAVSKA